MDAAEKNGFEKQKSVGCRYRQEQQGKQLSAFVPANQSLKPRKGLSAILARAKTESNEKTTTPYHFRQRISPHAASYVGHLHVAAA